LDDPRISRLVENWGRCEDFGLVAIASEMDNLAGAIWARLDRYDQLEDYGCPYPALGMAILPDYREQGAGTFLMTKFIESLRPRLDGLRLGVHPENKHAKHLYEKFGFVEYAIGAGQ
jgi:ribosomal protein S18 acetylase RimI-like enzyme